MLLSIFEAVLGKTEGINYKKIFHGNSNDPTALLLTTMRALLDSKITFHQHRNLNGKEIFVDKYRSIRKLNKAESLKSLLKYAFFEVRLRSVEPRVPH